MKKHKFNTPKIRTVTEIIGGKDQLKRDYDLSEFDAKNLNSLQSYDNFKTKLVLVKYMAMLHTLKLKDSLLALFRNRSNNTDIMSVVYASLGFVHNRVNSLVNNFDNTIQFVVSDNRVHTIPGEPIVFMSNDNDDIVCVIDRLSIVKMLERQFDTDINVDTLIKEKNLISMMKAFSNGGGGGNNRKRDADNDHFYNYNRAHDNDIKVSESEATRYLTLLMIMEHAYCHYVVLKNYGIMNYIKSMCDHELFASKCKPTMSASFDNLLLSKIKFTVDNGGNEIGKNNRVGILNFSSSANA
ncbi:ac144-like protein [Lambdina fiscellaria nucleopolyhedrovirus]|uniref:Ac144-like protein n=1 Tax=Lambdina fiscellaria nucleopolyhedrovirus TaxID=1642929 RepID=A0A0E3URS9_9ABAC|nr:ac144-like protein [Lambdina fiscellaria nucleopolyhedrovirus]AKC91754.1 ac144-like protein [Lambdina fiscellaria nucleopolyhedrovirus]